MERRCAAKVVGRVNAEVAVAALNGLHLPVLPDVEFKPFGDLAVILQSLIAIGFLVLAREGHLADLKQFRRRKKRHVRRIVIDRVAHAALVDLHHTQPDPLGLKRAGQARGAGTDHQHVKLFCLRFARMLHASRIDAGDGRMDGKLESLAGI
jgi:hypothetical protein